MRKCDPIEMRKNLDAVEVFKLHGVDFVPMPVKSSEHKMGLVVQGQAIFDEILYGQTKPTTINEFDIIKYESDNLPQLIVAHWDNNNIEFEVCRSLDDTQVLIDKNDAVAFAKHFKLTVEDLR